MIVNLITYTPNAIKVIYTACRTCYSHVSPCDIYISDDDHNKQLDLIRQTYESGHHSVLEHVNFTFAIEGVSRSLSHQLVRHRHASFSQQSQRYVDMSNGFIPVMPTAIFENEKAEEVFNDFLESVYATYNILREDVEPEDARSILPNAAPTNLVVTMNLRELILICNLRLCSQAQQEIRFLVQRMKRCVAARYPEFESYLVPKCEALGYCNETRKPCGRRPTKQQVFEIYEKYKGAD